MEAPDYLVGAHFKALDEGVLGAALKSTGYFSPFQFPWKCGEPHALLGGIHKGRPLNSNFLLPPCPPYDVIVTIWVLNFVPFRLTPLPLTWDVLSGRPLIKTTWR